MTEPCSYEIGDSIKELKIVSVNKLSKWEVRVQSSAIISLIHNTIKQIMIVKNIKVARSNYSIISSTKIKDNLTKVDSP